MSNLRKQLAAAAETAKLEAQKQTKRQKQIYDRKSTSRELDVGDKVLILQPTSTFKLFAKWDGPWVITRKLNAVNYEIDIGNRKTILHINMLKKWEERSDAVNLVMVDHEIQDEEVSFWNAIDDRNETTKFNIGGHLEPHQTFELQQLLDEFSDVFSQRLGRTDLIEHEIKVTDSRPCV